MKIKKISSKTYNNMQKLDSYTSFFINLITNLKFKEYLLLYNCEVNKKKAFYHVIIKKNKQKKEMLKCKSKSTINALCLVSYMYFNLRRLLTVHIQSKNFNTISTKFCKEFF